MYKLSSGDEGLSRSTYRRWVASWAARDHVHGSVGDEFGMALARLELSRAGALLKAFKAYGGWCAWQFDAVRELIRQVPPPAGDQLCIVLADRSEFTAPVQLLRGRVVYADTTKRAS